MKEHVGGAGTREAKGPRDAGAAGGPRDAGGPRAGGPRNAGAAGGAGSSQNGETAGSSRDGRAARSPRDAARQRREQMLRAALEVIIERGYAETRITDVAERTGTSPALVIYYFKTRDQLLTEAIRYSEDTWYAENLRRMEQIPTAAGRLAELVAAICLPGGESEPFSYWLMWLDLWALSPRNPGVAAVRQKSDEQWREAIRSIVLAGQEAGDFASVDVDDFTITLAALLDGLTVQIALEDPQVSPQRAYELAMRFASGELGFDWKPAPKRARQRGK
jgi:AcrR family transcriptional regulator